MHNQFLNIPVSKYRFIIRRYITFQNMIINLISKCCKYRD
uniref:Uncharacterized protein n=1 Tax=Arundo donax TaxID=35708 RepID=A0A0A8ZP88_ARUDO